MTGVLRRIARAQGLILTIAVVAVLALLVGTAGNAAAAVRPKLSEAGKKKRPSAQRIPTVPGHVIKAKREKLPGQHGTPVDAARPKAAWPRTKPETLDLSGVEKEPAGKKTWRRAGDLPVFATAPTAKAGARAAAKPLPGTLRVRVAERAAAQAVKSDGMVLSVSGETAGRAKVGINYAKFATAHGGDWASRLRLVQLPSCALTTPEDRKCQTRTPLPTVNDPASTSLSADVDVPAAPRTAAANTAGGVVLAAEAGSSGPGGDWTATQLTPASTWAAGTNTGEFSWSYPVRVPPVRGELMPPISIGYNSGAIDGKTAADNSQASWIGDGFDYAPGFIERKYKPCADDGQKSGDLCWGRDNAILSLNGQSTELLWDSAAKTWRPKNDDGSTIERLTGAQNGDDNGEYWRVTTLDGVQYYFGLNRPDDWTSGKTETNSAFTVPVFGDDSGEPCHAAAFKDAWCRQAWRWNVDHVVDPHKNTITYFYAKETNNYTRVEQTSGGTNYVSGGHLQRIDYGQREGSTYATPATARVRFDVADRTDFPDDQVCADGKDCGFSKLSPTFFDRKRLTKITTELLTDKAARTYSPVDVFDLGQTYQNGVLWLNTIDETGKWGGDTKAPRVTLTGQLMPNRVVTGRSGTGIDGLPAYDRPRLVGVSNGTGSTTTVGYSDPYVTPTPAGECVYSSGGMPDPKSNTKRCFPVKWMDPTGKVVNDWYHKYVAEYIIESDATGGSRSTRTDYQYVGGAAWRYAEDDGLTKDKWRTWSQWRGYAKVRTIVGDGQNGEEQSRTETAYLRGMDGNYQGKGATPLSVTVTDSGDLLGGIRDIDTLASSEIETRVFLSSFTDASVISATVSKPRWHETVTRTFNDTNSGDDITVHGGWVKTDWAKVRERTAAGTFRSTETYFDYDDLGRTIAADQEGDPTTASDDVCERSVYPSGSASGTVIRTLPIRSISVTADCDNPASSEPNLAAGDLISDVKTIYDGGTYGSYPTKGDDSKIETSTGVTDGRSVTRTAVVNVHDTYGRVTSTTEVGDPATTTDDRTTTSVYTDAPEGWLKSTATTLPPVKVGSTTEGFTTTTEYSPARGVPLKVVDTNERTAEAEYDGLGRIVRAWLPNNPREADPDHPSTIYSYNFPTDGNPISIVTKTLTDNDPAVYETSVELLDGQLRPRQTQTEAPGGGRLVSDTKYDSRGLVFKANAPYHMAGDPSGVLTTADDNQVPSQTLATYDGAGRVLTSTLYSKSTEKWTTTTQYRGEQTIVIPPSGAMPTMSITDTLGRVVETRQYETSDLSGPYLASTVAYDSAGRPTERRDGAGNVWKTTYDVLGRPATSTDPDKGTSTATYDDFDQVKTVKDARGNVITFTYDKLGRVLQTSSGSTPLTSFTYDTVEYAKGLPATATRHIGGEAYTTAITGYDGLYQPFGTTVTIPASQGKLAGTYTTTQEYNFDGSLLSTAYPAIGGSTGLPAETVTTYRNGDNLPDWTSGLSTYVADTVYNSYGDVSQLALASVSDKFVWQTFAYDESTQRLTNASVKRQSSLGAADVESRYDYTDAGSISSIVTNTVGTSTDRQCFTYDYAQRLTDAWSTDQNACATPSATTIGGPAPYWTSYQYTGDGEKTGNRTKEIQHAFTGGPSSDKVRTYNYPGSGTGIGPAGPHALGSVNETQGTTSRTDLYTYDAAGNTVTRPGQKLTWDAEGHLSKVTDDSGKDLAGFLYDAGGERLIRKDTSGTTLYLPGQELRVSAAGTVSAIRYYSHGGETVAYRTGTSSSTVQFLVPDYQGSSDVTVNAVDQSTWSLRRFGPFGTERTNAINLWPTAMDKGYLGGTKDTTTGLTHLGAREYDPSTGRFASVDPVFAGGDPLTWNGFAYAANNPISNADPDGLACASLPGGGSECFYPPHHRKYLPKSPGGGGGGGSGGGSHGGLPPIATGGGGAAGVPQITPPAPPPCTSWYCKAKNFVSKHRATIISTAAGIGCSVAIGWTGAGGVACAAAAGALYGAISYSQNTPRDQWTAGGFIKQAAIGAAVGVAVYGVTGLAGKAAGPIIQRVAPKIATKIKLGIGGKGGSVAKGNPAAKGAARSATKKTATKEAGPAGGGKTAAKEAPSGGGGKTAAEEAPSGGGGTCRLNSFPVGTRVLMANGSTKPIDEVRVGDKVAATDPEAGGLDAKTVTATSHRQAGMPLTTIVIDTDGTKGTKTAKVAATDEHPFWLPEKHRWADAKDLKRGDRLRTSTGAWVEITAVQHQPIGYNRVHNLTITDHHTFYALAGTNPLLVHNSEPCGEHSVPGLPRAASEITDGPGDCAACAKAIQSNLGGGDLVRFNPPRFFGPYRGQDTMEWTHHWVVVKDGRVYDAFTPRAGETIAQYKAQWEYGDVINFGF